MRVRRLPAPRLLLAGLLVALMVPLARAERVAYDPTFRAGPAEEILVAGPPALTHGHLDDFVDLFESAFDVALRIDEEQRIRDAFEDAYRSASGSQREQVLALRAPIVGLRKHAAAGDTAAVHAALRDFRLKLDAWTRASPSHRAAPAILRVLARRHAATWPGTPLVKGGPADAYLEVAAFLTGLGRNEAFTPSEGQRSAMLEDLARRLAGQPAKVRERLTTVHRLWLRAKAAWDRAGRDAAHAEKRRSLREAAVRFVAGILPPDRKFEPELDGTLDAYVAAATRIAESARPFDLYANVARNPALLLHTLETGLALEGPLLPWPFMYR